MPMRPMSQRREMDFNRMNSVFGPPTREFQNATGMEPPPPPDMFGSPSPQFQQATTEPGFQLPQSRGPNPQNPFSIPDVNMDFQQPENQSLRRFMEMAVPERGNPNIVSKIGASMMSLGRSPEDVDKALHSRYYGQLSDYQNQANNLLKSAQIEGQQNQYAGLNAYRQGQLDLGAGRLGVSQTNAQTAQQRARNAEILAGMPNVRVKEGKNGQPDIWYDSKSGKELMREPSGSMDPVARYRMEQEGRMDVVEAQQEGAMDRARVGATTDLTIAGMPARPSSTTPSASQQSVQIDNIAGDLIRQNPTWGKWLTKDTETGEWTVAEANTGGWFSSGPPADVRKKIVDALKLGGAALPQAPQQTAPGLPPKVEVPPGQGQGNSVNQTPIGGNNPEYSGFGPKVKIPPMAPMPAHEPTQSQGGGRVRLISPDGREGDADPSKVQALIAKGYRVVQ